MDDFDMQQQADEFEADEVEDEYEVEDDFPEELEYEGLFGHYSWMDYIDYD